MGIKGKNNPYLPVIIFYIVKLYIHVTYSYIYDPIVFGKVHREKNHIIFIISYILCRLYTQTWNTLYNFKYMLDKKNSSKKHVR